MSERGTMVLIVCAFIFCVAVAWTPLRAFTRRFLENLERRNWEEECRRADLCPDHLCELYDTGLWMGSRPWKRCHQCDLELDDRKARAESVCAVRRQQLIEQGRRYKNL